MDGSLKCKPCNKIFNGVHPYNDHYASKKHKKKVNDESLLVVDSTEPLPNSEEFGIDEHITEQGNMYKCNVCNVFMNNILPAESHVKGQKHLKAVSRLRNLTDSSENKNTTESGNISAADSEIEPKFSSWVECRRFFEKYYNS